MPKKKITVLIKIIHLDKYEYNIKKLSWLHYFIINKLLQVEKIKKRREKQLVKPF
jgi:hypothetical protein